MRRLRIAVLDLVTKAPTRALYARIMHPNLASIMPQVVGASGVSAPVTTSVSSATPGSRTCARAARRLDIAVRRRVHPVRAARVRHQQSVPPAAARSPCWAGRTPAAIRRMRPVLRLRARLHGQSAHRGSTDGLRAAPPRGLHLAARRQPSELPALESAGSSSSPPSPRPPPSRSCRCSGAWAARTPAASASTPRCRTSRSASQICRRTCGS